MFEGGNSVYKPVRVYMYIRFCLINEFEVQCALMWICLHVTFCVPTYGILFCNGSTRLDQVFHDFRATRAGSQQKRLAQHALVKKISL